MSLQRHSETKMASFRLWLSSRGYRILERLLDWLLDWPRRASWWRWGFEAALKGEQGMAQMSEAQNEDTVAGKRTPIKQQCSKCGPRTGSTWEHGRNENFPGPFPACWTDALEVSPMIWVSGSPAGDCEASVSWSSWGIQKWAVRHRVRLGVEL